MQSSRDSQSLNSSAAPKLQGQMGELNHTRAPNRSVCHHVFRQPCGVANVWLKILKKTCFVPVPDVLEVNNIQGDALCCFHLSIATQRNPAIKRCVFMFVSYRAQREFDALNCAKKVFIKVWMNETQVMKCSTIQFLSIKAFSVWQTTL